LFVCLRKPLLPFLFFILFIFGLVFILLFTFLDGTHVATEQNQIGTDLGFMLRVTTYYTLLLKPLNVLKSDFDFTVFLLSLFFSSFFSFIF
jgi:hypothetical protein